MKHLRQRLHIITLAVALGVILVWPVSADYLRVEDSACCTIVKRALAAAEQIKGGMKRSEVEESFMNDGGLSSSDEARYVYKGCHFIKIKVKYTLASGNPLKESPEDTVKVVSIPYLQMPFMN